MVSDSEYAAVVAEGSDRVVDLTVPYDVKVFVGVCDERDKGARHLHEGLTSAAELDLAGRVDCGDLLGLHVQDNPF